MVRSKSGDAGIVGVVGLAEGTVGLGVESLAQQFFLDVRVPVVLYLVVSSPWQSPCFQELNVI